MVVNPTYYHVTTTSGGEYSDRSLLDQWDSEHEEVEIENIVGSGRLEFEGGLTVYASKNWLEKLAEEESGSSGVSYRLEFPDHTEEEIDELDDDERFPITIYFDFGDRMSVQKGQLPRNWEEDFKNAFEDEDIEYIFRDKEDTYEIVFRRFESQHSVTVTKEFLETLRNANSEFSTEYKLKGLEWDEEYEELSDDEEVTVKIKHDIDGRFSTFALKKVFDIETYEQLQEAYDGPTWGTIKEELQDGESPTGWERVLRDIEGGTWLDLQAEISEDMWDTLDDILDSPPWDSEMYSLVTHSDLSKIKSELSQQTWMDLDDYIQDHLNNNFQDYDSIEDLFEDEPWSKKSEPITLEEWEQYQNRVPDDDWNGFKRKIEQSKEKYQIYQRFVDEIGTEDWNELISLLENESFQHDDSDVVTEPDWNEFMSKLRDNTYDLVAGYLGITMYANEHPGLHMCLYGSRDDEHSLTTFHKSGSYILRADNMDRLFRENEDVINKMDEIGFAREGFDPVDNFTIPNIVGQAVIGRDEPVENDEDKIPLNRLTMLLGTEFLEYHPESFPAIVYHGYEGMNTKFLLFANRKVIMPGNSSMAEVDEAYEKFKAEVLEWSDVF